MAFDFTEEALENQVLLALERRRLRRAGITPALALIEKLRRAKEASLRLPVKPRIE